MQKPGIESAESANESGPIEADEVPSPPEYSIALVKRTLSNYLVTQEHGLDRGSDGQVAAIAKRTDVWYAFNALSEIERKVVYLHLIQGFTQDDVAEQLRRNQSTVSRHAKRAVRKLVEFLNRPIVEQEESAS